MDEVRSMQVAELEEKLQLRKALVDITNRIHGAQNLRQILIDLKDGILNLFSAHSITIYVVDRARSEIYSLLLVGARVKEIRVPINNRSIAGYVASAGRTVNIADAYDAAELRAIDERLAFDQRWDRQSGFRTRQILAAPIFHNGMLMGVVQILNKKGGAGAFTGDEAGFLREIADVLGVAFFNQGRYTRKRVSRYDDLIGRNLITQAGLDSARGD
ncbi:MAG: GAF domain-containing protein, partial [Thermodesulfobacteriota bacterium]